MNANTTDMEGGYRMGRLRQCCSDPGCGWSQEDLRKEVEVCPKCGKPVDPYCVLSFGGLEVAFNAARGSFTLRRPGEEGEEMAVIDEADAADTAQFILRHAKA